MKKVAVIFIFLFSITLSAQKGLLWQIVKEGKDTSYIFGTIHAPNKRFVNVVPQLHKVKRKVDIGVFELILNQDSVSAFMSKLQSTVYAAASSQLKTTQVDELFNLLSTKLGVDSAVLSSMHPVLMESILMQGFAAADTNAAVDALLQSDFQSSGKPLVALEYYEEQYDVLFNDNTIQHWLTLYDLVKNWNKHKDNWQDLEAKYLQQDLTALLSMITKANNDGFLNSNAINTQRNVKMVSRLLPIINKQSALIAVGAAHLAGEEGVLNLLKKAGFKVRAILQ